MPQPPPATASDEASRPQLVISAGAPDLISVAISGRSGNGPSDFPAISADSRFVAFDSFATDLVADDTNGFADVFVRDRLRSETVRVSVGPLGVQGDESSSSASLSADGRSVAFSSFATNFGTGPLGAAQQVYVRDLGSAALELVSVSQEGLPGNGASRAPSVSVDGRYVAFASDASDLVPGDTNEIADVFVRDRASGRTVRVSIASDGSELSRRGPYCQGATWPSISGDGNVLVFTGCGSALVPGADDDGHHAYIRDRVRGLTSVVPEPAGASSCGGGKPALSGDRRVVVDAPCGSVLAYEIESGRIEWFDTPTFLPSPSADGSLVSHGFQPDFRTPMAILVRDRTTGVSVRVSDPPDGAAPDGSAVLSAMSGRGDSVVFGSEAGNLVPGDGNGTGDVFFVALE